MKIKNSERIFFICAIVLNLLVLGLLTAKPLVIQKSAEKNERILRLKCNLYDPYDPMKGRYVRLTFDENNKNVKDIKFDEEILFEDNRKEGENKSWRIKIPALYAVFENNEEAVIQDTVRGIQILYDLKFEADSPKLLESEQEKVKNLAKKAFRK